MGQHFKAFMTVGRLVTTDSLVFLVDNRLSSKAIHVEKITIGSNAGLAEAVQYRVRGGLSFGATIDNSSVVTPVSMLAGQSATLENVTIREWLGTGAMAGISGVTAGSSVINETGLFSLGANQIIAAAGLVIPAGGSIGVYGSATSAGMLVGIEATM